MKVGDKVRVIGVPSDVDDAATKWTYQMCLGHDFIVASITVPGCAELQIEAITGTSGDLIHVPFQFLKIITGA